MYKVSKEDILREIRKGGQENGGIPLSTKRFEEKTGIKPYYWQKYWSRFSQAQSEAGFIPNSFLKPSYDSNYLCEKFIALMRELKKWPTKGEVEVKHNSDAGFPGSSIFYKNLGIKQDLASKILEYAEGKKYDDIVTICNSILEEFKNQSEFPEDTENQRHGYVYMLKLGRYHKVGRSNDMGRRYRELSIQFPDDLIEIHKIETDDPSGIEAYWHKRFKAKHIKGEWFSLSPFEVRAFKRWARII